LIGALGIWALALALLWRLGSWHVGPAEALIEDEGLSVGDTAPEIAAHLGDRARHLTFGGETTFVAFGLHGCEPCRDLVNAAASHPATSYMRLVYLSDVDKIDVESQIRSRWEIYRFDNASYVRRQWRAPVSPYFHVVDEAGCIVAKGVANRPEHLDRLLGLGPPGLTTSVPTDSDRREERDVARSR